jgi:hypothetical protein
MKYAVKYTVCGVALFLAACTPGANGDGGGAVPGENDARVGRTADAGTADARPDGSTDDAGEGGSGGTGGGSGGAGANGGAGGEGDCAPASVRCLEEGGNLRELCREDARWVVQPCDDDGVCFNGGCFPNPQGCSPGSGICVTRAERAICQGNEWVEAESCVGGDICIDGQCENAACAQAEAELSYLGCEYLAVELPNSAFVPQGGTTPESPVGVVVANPSTDASAKITITDPLGRPAALRARQVVAVPDIPEIQGLYQATTVVSEIRDAAGQAVESDLDQAVEAEIPPGGIGVFLLPHGVFQSSTGVTRQAYRVRTDRPVAAYQFSPLCCNYSFSNDASLLIPVHTYGTDYRFLGVPTWLPFGGSPTPGAMAVVAPTDGIDVTVTVPAGQTVLADVSGRVRQQGNTITARLDSQEVMLLQTDSVLFGNQPDLSGATITTSAPVAVFSSHMCTYYPELLGACDHVEEQLFPTGTWGREFVLTPPVRRGDGGFGSSEAVYWKIQAREAGARIRFSRPFAELAAVPPGFAGVPDCASMMQGDELVLEGNAFCEFGTMEPVALQSSIPLMVMGIISGQSSTGIDRPFGAQAGDPAIFLLPPDRQYRDDYVFLVPDTYANDVVTVVADANAMVALDGVPLNLADALPVPGSARVYKHISVSDGPHHLNGDTPFGILVVAFDDFVSYAFTGGLNLRKR